MAGNKREQTATRRDMICDDWKQVIDFVDWSWRVAVSEPRSVEPLLA
jgi:hypothetical protein